MTAPHAAHASDAGNHGNPRTISLYAAACQVLRHPRSGWGAIAARPHSASALIMRLILPGSLVSALAVTAGITWFNRDWHDDFGYSAPASQALSIGFATLALSALYALVLAGVFTLTGKMYRSRGSYVQALLLVAYGTLPVWIAGAFMFLMPAALLGMLVFVYACLIYSQGAHAVLGIAESETTEFVAISLLLAALVMTVLSMMASALHMV